MREYPWLSVCCEPSPTFQILDAHKVLPNSGTPLQPMLGSITRSLTEVYTRLGSRPFVSEAKLDGQRGQIHVALEAPIGESGRGTWYDPAQNGADGRRIWVRLFSRHLEDQTDKYPDMFPTLSVSLSRRKFDERIHPDVTLWLAGYHGARITRQRSAYKLHH